MEKKNEVQIDEGKLAARYFLIKTTIELLIGYTASKVTDAVLNALLGGNTNFVIKIGIKAIAVMVGVEVGSMSGKEYDTIMSIVTKLMIFFKELDKHENLTNEEIHQMMVRIFKDGACGNA